MVTNEEYNAAVTQYTPLMTKFLRKFARNHTERDEVKSILLTELWLAMENHDSQKSNFLTYLHNRFNWACCNKISKENNIGQHERTLPENTNKFSFRESMSMLINDELIAKLKTRLNDQANQVLDLLLSGLNARQISEQLELSEQRISQIFLKICETGHRVSGNEMQE
jgi:RNA polymerase sigma factor (sigma-70 family)